MADESFFMKSNPTKRSDQIKNFGNKKGVKLSTYYPKNSGTHPTSFTYGKVVGQSSNSKTKSNQSESLSSKHMINISKLFVF